MQELINKLHIAEFSRTTHCRNYSAENEKFCRIFRDWQKIVVMLLFNLLGMLYWWKIFSPISMALKNTQILRRNRRWSLISLMEDSDYEQSIQIWLAPLRSEVSRIINTTVFDLDTKAIEENQEDQFPEILKLFQNQKYTITLDLTKNNLKNGSIVYGAYEILDAVELTGNFDRSIKRNQ